MFPVGGTADTLANCPDPDRRRDMPAEYGDIDGAKSTSWYSASTKAATNTIYGMTGGGGVNLTTQADYGRMGRRGCCVCV